MNHWKTKRKLPITIIFGIIIFIILFNLKNNYPIFLNKEKNTTGAVLYPRFEADAYFTKEEDLSNQFQPDMVEYLKEALLEGTLEEKINKISGGSVELTASKKKEIIKKDTSGRLDNYQKSVGETNDKWFLVNLSENGNDIVIQHKFTEGILIYYFPQEGEEGTYEQALPAKGDGGIYFINWKGTNYMLLTNWDEEKKHINGIDIYYYSGPLIGELMRMNIHNADIEISYYTYIISQNGKQPEGSTVWP